MTQTTNSFSLDDAKTICENLYGIHGELKKLPGELDANFLIETKTNCFVLKIAPENQNIKHLHFQNAIISHLNHTSKNYPVIVVPSLKGEDIVSLTDLSYKVCYARIFTWVSGRVWSNVSPITDSLLNDLGEKSGEITRDLSSLHHNYTSKNFDWDLAQSLWTKNNLQLFSGEQLGAINHFQSIFSSKYNQYTSLRKSIVHNDVNDNNIVVSEAIKKPEIKGIIDFGDACYTQTINDLAITCAYAAMHKEDPLRSICPLIKGYHTSYPLQEKELDFLYVLIGMRLVVSVTKSAINKKLHPTNTYLSISEKPAWDLLYKWQEISEERATSLFKITCGFPIHSSEIEFNTWVSKNKFSLQSLFPSINKQHLHHIDCSVSSRWLGMWDTLNDSHTFQFKLATLQKKHPDTILSGGYLELRPVYASNAYLSVGNNGLQHRNLHLGVDYWLPENTPVHTILDAEVVVSKWQSQAKDYGGLIILKHTFSNFSFYTLYGHLSKASVSNLKVGSTLKKGDCIGFLGNENENGNWAPHLHFQLTLSLLGNTENFPGLAYPHEIEYWKRLCPDPNVLFQIQSNLEEPKDFSELIQYRKNHLGKSLSLQYNNPLKIVRGCNQFLIDENGTYYLDTVNNVAHVGHENANVVSAGQNQMALLNTNTRYLNETLIEATKALLETFPPELNVVHFVNSGSEANELALRMAKATTQGTEFLVSEHGYHGNTNACIDISAYKFNGKGGNGVPKHTHVFPIPDAFNGKHKGETSATNYALEIEKTIQHIKSNNQTLAGFIIEPILSCGGQVELANGFLKKTYKIVRDAGGVCISDEVQTGCGRMGKTFWGFQLHDVIPDIVTIGKPLGNGHPVAAVVCTQKVANAFANGMEYFNTFGGNPVSCVIALEVLKEIRAKKLQENALRVGNFLKEELNSLAKSFPIIGSVRGQGLFLGIEFVSKDKGPLPEQTKYLVERMKEHKILMSIDGPFNNVVKIKPPLTFSKEQAKLVLDQLDKILSENFMQYF